MAAIYGNIHVPANGKVINAYTLALHIHNTHIHMPQSAFMLLYSYLLDSLYA